MTKLADRPAPVTRNLLESGQDISVLKVLLYQLEAPLAVRVILSLVFRLLRSRVDLGLISKLRQNELRGKTVELIREIVTSEHGDTQTTGHIAPTPTRPDATPSASVKVEAAASQKDQRLAAPTASVGAVAHATVAPLRPPASRVHRTRLPDADTGIEVAEIPSFDDDGILSMTADELEFFARTAHKDMQGIFVNAMHEKRKRQYTQLFGGGFTVKLSGAARRDPPFRVFLPGARTCLLPEEQESAKSLGLAEQQMTTFIRWVWSYWTQQGFPEHFRVEASNTSPAGR